MITLEVYGGAMAAYLRRYPKRQFKSEAAAGRYMSRIATLLDEMGVRAAHPMWCVKAGADITSQCWDAARGHD